MRRYTVIVTDDVEDYFVDVMRFVASRYTMDAAIRYAKRIRMEIEELSYLADVLPTSKYQLPKLYHPEAKTLVIGNKKLTVVFHIDGDYVVVDIYHSFCFIHWLLNVKGSSRFSALVVCDDGVFQIIL